MLKLTRNGCMWPAIYLVLAVVATISFVMIGFRWFNTPDPVEIIPETMAPEPMPPEPIIIDVEGVGCVMDPVIQFDTQTGYTLITLECDTELLYHYLPAAPAEE